MPSIRRILHLAPFNTSGVPITFVRAERELGFESRLITLGRDPRGYEEDLCLDLPFLDFAGTRWAKKIFSDPVRLQVANRHKIPAQIPPVWTPHSWPEKWLVKFRETVWQKKISRAMAAVDFWNFDLYQLEGGLEFFRDGRTVRALKKRGKPVICLYTGSDLRTRGVIPEIDRLADLHLTLEFDHLALHTCIQHVFFPLDLRRFALAPPRHEPRLVIGHAPTNHAAKGSATIIAVVQSLQNEFPLDLELIEGLPHHEALRRKARCDIFIDQIGELGYGVNAVEALAMGICTCTGLETGFAEKYPDHPFVEVRAENLRARLAQLCQCPEERNKFRQRSREWAERMHDSRQVVRQIHEMLHVVLVTSNQHPASSIQTMRLLFINSIQMFGGGEIWMLRTLRALQERGHQVWLCCRPVAEIGKRAVEQKIPVEFVKFGGDIDPRTIFKLVRFMKRERIEIVLTNMDKELRLGGLAAKLAGVPVVIPRRGIDYPLKNRWRYRFAYNVLATHLMANSQATKRALLCHAPWLNAERIDVIYNGIDPEPFAQPGARNFRAEWNVKPDEPLLGFVGQFDERKGIRVLLAAFHHIKRESPQARLVFVGQGPLREIISDEVKKHQWGETVLLPGFLDDVAGVMQAIDILLLPSFWEGFGIVLIEAMAASKPAISTVTSSMPEIIVDGETGYIVPPGDAEALAERAVKLLRDVALREKFGHASRQCVEEKFTHRRMIDEIESLFQRELKKATSQKHRSDKL